MIFQDLWDWGGESIIWEKTRDILKPVFNMRR